MKFYLLLGDQLNLDSQIFDRVDKQQDYLWMAEVPHEATKVFSHKARIVMFLAAMRHFREQLKRQGYQLIYQVMEEAPHGTLGAQLAADIRRYQPTELVVVQPGEYSVALELQQVAKEHQLTLTCLEDTHFICSESDFGQWFDSIKQPRQESFYRMMRHNSGILMQDNKPVGGSWNYDKQNRKTFTKAGPGILPAWPCFPPDKITRQVIKTVKQRFADHPGSLEEFDWPVTRQDAVFMLNDFIDYRLPVFGTYQDAMWTDEPFLYHAGLSAALNIKLLNPREVLDSVLQAYNQRKLSLSSVEGFVRQILGWREYVHGLYWQLMPNYIESNALNAQHDLPALYWSADTDMVCLRQVVQQTLDYAYAHHIQRLMVTGLFALLFGVQPQQLHQWYLAIYVDAVEWVELPNTLGMSQYADGGILASKPYVASGKYIQRMSNYCDRCPFDPAQSIGERACPVTTLYWDFLRQHTRRFKNHPRTALQWRNLQRLNRSQLRQIAMQAEQVRTQLST